MAAPAPGSPEKTSVSAVGARGERAPSPAARHDAQGGRIIYADVHRKARNGESYRITFTTDGVTFRHVDRFLDIPAVAGDKVFVDVLPLHHTDGAIELLKRGVEVYYLRRTTLISRKREELKLSSKTTRNDIRVLMSLEEKWFRRVTEDFLVMRRMIACYRSLLKSHQQLLNKSKALSENERGVLKPAVKAIEQQMETLAKQIAEEAGRRYPAYNVLVDVLGIAGNPPALEALAEVLLPEWRSWMRIRAYFGAYPRGRDRRFHKSKTGRQALERLTMSVKGRIKSADDLDEVLKKIWITMKTLKAQKAGSPPA